jgi:hypothetical protein
VHKEKRVGTYRHSAHRARRIILPSPNRIACDGGKRRMHPKRCRIVSVHSTQMAHPRCRMRNWRSAYARLPTVASIGAPRPRQSGGFLSANKSSSTSLRSHATQADQMSISPAVERLLSEPLFRESGASYDQRELIKAANDIGLPMKLLHWRKLEELRCLPAFAERHADDALSGVERFGAPAVEIFMVSHRWLRPSITRTLAHPDDA